MSEMGEKSIFVQFRATPQDRKRLAAVIKSSSAEGRSEWFRMAIDKAWRALPEDKK
jgi:hypothetical protein